MTSTELPIHPITGLKALAIGKRGPIWPVLGGAPDDDEQNDNKRGLSMTYSQAINRIAEIEARMTELSEMDTLTPELESEYQELRDEVFQVDDHRKRLERADELAQVKRVSGQAQVSVRAKGIRVVPGSSQGSRNDYDRDAILEPDSVEDCRFKNPWDLSELRTYGRDPEAVSAELRSRALSAIEKMQGASDNIRQTATQLLERHDTGDSKIAKLCLVTSAPAYVRAFAKKAKDPFNAQLTPEEARAWAEADNFRAMSLTDSAGGYLVPFQLDPTVIVTSSGSYSEVRSIARQVIATGDVWNGVSSAAVSWSWDAEASEVSDDAPSFAQPSIPIYKAQGFVPISIEALQDEQNVTQEIGKLLSEGKLDIEGPAFVTGSGSNQPTGIVTALTGTSSVVPAATDDTFALADVYATQGALPQRWRRNASWLANNLIYNKIRQFDTAGGAGLWTTLGNGTPMQLLGRNVAEAEAMDGTVTTNSATANYVLIFGDFSNYVIADRIGMTVELVPHLFGSSRRPNGQRGWLAYYRVGADSVNDNAFRMLNVASAS